MLLFYIVSDLCDRLHGKRSIYLSKHVFKEKRQKHTLLIAPSNKQTRFAFYTSQSFCSRGGGGYASASGGCLPLRPVECLPLGLEGVCVLIPSRHTPLGIPPGHTPRDTHPWTHLSRHHPPPFWTSPNLTVNERSSWYASYWNAFLFHFVSVFRFSLFKIEISNSIECLDVRKLYIITDHILRFICHV